jgi:hypothetical protein
VPTAALIAANLQTCFPVGLPVLVWTDMVENGPGANHLEAP